MNQSENSKRSYWPVILFFTLLFGFGIFALFYILPWIGEKASNLVPVEAEVQIGESLSQVYVQENKMSRSANRNLDEFVKHLELDDTYKIDADIIESDEINAFALPGGKIFIYSGIIQHMHSYEELVALLGHEATHVSNRHSLKSICRSAATSLILSSLFGDVGGITSGILSQAEEFKQLDYSRDLETEADDNGYTLMLQNKVAPKGMLNLLKVLKAGDSVMPQLMKYLSTHPDTDARIANISSKPGITTTFPVNTQLQDLFLKIKEAI